MKKWMLSLLLLLLFAEINAQTKKTVTRRTRVNKTVIKPTEPDRIDTVEMVIPVQQGSYKEQLVGKWQLLNVRKQQKDAPTPLGRGYFIEFRQDNAFMGFSGCNSFGGKYSATGATLLLREMVSTEMACDATGMEAVVQKQLGSIKSFAVTDTGIALKDGTGSTVFECKRL